VKKKDYLPFFFVVFFLVVFFLAVFFLVAAIPRPPRKRLLFEITGTVRYYAKHIGTSFPQKKVDRNRNQRFDFARNGHIKYAIFLKISRRK
jgi:hypothetical protein